MTKVNLYKFFQFVVSALSVLYPVLLVIGIRTGYLRLSLGLFLAFLILRLIFLKKKKMNQLEASFLMISILSILILGYAFVNHVEVAAMFYPVIVNSVLAIVFGKSLLFENTPIIELLAKIKHPQIDANIKRYTKKVTQVWFVFFVFNGIIALLSIFWKDGAYWLAYNGFISYLLIGALSLIEWIVRRKTQSRFILKSEKVGSL